MDGAVAATAASAAIAVAVAATAATAAADMATATAAVPAATATAAAATALHATPGLLNSGHQGLEGGGVVDPGLHRPHIPGLTEAFLGLERAHGRRTARAAARAHGPRAAWAGARAHGPRATWAAARAHGPRAACAAAHHLADQLFWRGHEVAGGGLRGRSRLPRTAAPGRVSQGGRPPCHIFLGNGVRSG